MAFGEYKLKWEKGRFSKKSKEPYTLSRSKIEFFTECPRCFWIEARYGIGRPSSFPFTLNNVVDELFKKEYDAFREKAATHPLMTQYNIDAVPFNDPRMEEWRDALKRGVKATYAPANITLRGGVDDVWIKPDGSIHVVDYKATGGKDVITLDDAWKDSYKRQVEIYQWLFRQNGFTVSPIAYFVYANAKNDRNAFDARLDFEITILPYEGDDSWVGPKLEAMRACLDDDAIPDAGARCEYCPYRAHAGKKLLELHREAKK